METTNLAQGGQELDQSQIMAGVIGIIVVFAAVARGAHDIWAATLVYLAVLFLSAFFLALSPRVRTDKIRLPLLLPLLLFLTAVVFSFARSSNPSESFLELMDICVAMLIFILSANIFRSPVAFSSFLIWIVPCLWFENVLMIVSVVATRHKETAQYLISAHPVALYFLRIPEIFDAEKMGSLINANLLSVFVLPLLVLLGGKVIEQWRDKKSISYFWGSGVCAALIGLVLSKSGSAWMSLLISLLGLGIWFQGPELWRRHKQTVFAVMAAGVAVVTAVLVYKFMHKINLAVDPHRNNFNRLYWWASAWHMFLDYPLTGIGIGNFGSAYLTYKIGGTENTLYAHGLPFTLLCETGLLGTVTFAVLLTALARAVRSLSLSSVRTRCCLVALASVALFHMINIGVEYLVNLLVLAVLAGMVVANVPAFSMKPRLSSVIIGVALVLGAVPFVVSPFFASQCGVAASAAWTAGDLVQAEKSFNEAMALDPRNWEPYVGLARIANKRGDLAAATAWQQQAWERNKLSLPLKRELESYQRLVR